ncbi:MAG TPA: HD domain-containing phosphohydrolase [Candidatus Limnocylindrales bacterium]|nr:HD domain-containing phosphohydrolase [Candidatus Limnocylindrales bacterium]
MDDEPNVLQALERQLRKQFEISTAEGPVQGLEAIEKGGPFAVIVSDLRMPIMNGIQFLAKVKEASPNTIRIILSGQGDFAAVIQAVNEGSIFRFLTKPCATEQLAITLTAALEQYRLVQAERELLEHTLSGCIELLSEILSFTNPSAFSRSHRIRRYVRHMAGQLGLPDPWQYEVAAMLSQIGCVTISPDVLERAYSGVQLSKSEADAFASQYEVAGKLLARIPRLEQVARIVGAQQKAMTQPVAAKTEILGCVDIGVELLQIASEFDQGLVRGLTRETALSEIRVRREHNLDLIATLQAAEVPDFGTQARLVGVHELRCGMVINGEVRAKNGLLLFAKGQEVTEALIERLKNFAMSSGVVQPFSVIVPQACGAQVSERPRGFDVSNTHGKPESHFNTGAGGTTVPEQTSSCERL